MRSVTKDNMITALGAPELPIDMFKNLFLMTTQSVNPQKAALTGMDLLEFHLKMHMWLIQNPPLLPLNQLQMM